MKKNLSLIHIEAGSKLIPRMEEPEAAVEIVATYIADPATLRLARTKPEALDSFRAAAEEMPADEAQGIVADFFGQWSNYQENTLSCIVPHVERIKEAAAKVTRQNEVILG